MNQLLDFDTERDLRRERMERIAAARSRRHPSPFGRLVGTLRAVREPSARRSGQSTGRHATRPVRIRPSYEV